MNTTEQREPHLTESAITNSQKAELLCLHESPVVRALYLATGFIALFLAVLGAILPILPTTPFVLLAAACFARGSEYCHHKLLENRIAGPIIRDWQLYRSISRRVKRWVYFLMSLSFGSSILIVPEIWQKIMLATIGLTLAFFIRRIPERV